MVYPAAGDYNSGVCPKSHSVAIYSIFHEFFYDTSPYSDFNKFVYATGGVTGYRLHGAFINGWTNRVTLQNASPSCSGPDGAQKATCSINAKGGSAEFRRQKLPRPWKT